MPELSRVRRHIDRILATQPPRAGSLAITVFGDCISQQGDSVWLGSLVDVMAAFGLNARQVRTAIFRLRQDGWLTSQQLGRRSYYRLSESGQCQYERAAARIYAGAPAPWDGKWILVMPDRIESSTREELRKRLGWLGFGMLTGGVMAHPRIDRGLLADTLTELGLSDHVIVWRARLDSDVKLHGLVHGAWQLDDLQARYRSFIADFSPFRKLLAGGRMPAEQDAFILRSLLVHQYRRILLRSTDLPTALLPRRWCGHTAMDLVRDLYCALHAPASHYACARLSNAAGCLPPPSTAFYQRLGGIATLFVSASTLNATCSAV